jgi:hypothetical protein
MTEGQQLAIDQLRAVEDANRSALAILDIDDSGPDGSWVQVDVSIDCSQKPCTNGGVQLNKHERFTFNIPADFPYQLPLTQTRHIRFAGLPHVQFNRHLGLYQAPATEWNVDDGMFGYLERLDSWLNHAARGNLNPSGEALHPPVAYPSTGRTRTVIPRVDTPPVTAENWIGFAQLDKFSEFRADLVGWMKLEDVGEGIQIAPALLISQPMPFEYPSKMADLTSELENRGVSMSQIIALLGLAVMFNRENDPLFVILGTPMRGVAGEGQKQFHLAVWHIEPVFVRGLRLGLNRFHPDPRFREIGEEVTQMVIEWLNATDVGWCTVREDRPQIVVSRDRASATAWFRDKTVSLWGCGAIGSHLAEFLARSGARKLILHDSGVVTPGLLTRQLFSENDIGKPKVRALSERLKTIRPSIEIEEHLENLISGLLSSQDWTSGADIVIESTGSSSVLSKTEAVRRRSVARSTFVSMAVGHSALNSMMLISRPGYSGGKRRCKTVLTWIVNCT